MENKNSICQYPPHCATDKGLGLVLQSTGRNMQETQEIAKILEEQYS